MKAKISILGFCCLMGILSVVQASEIKVLGLFSGKVLLQINGQSKVLMVGEKYKDIEIISADSKHCVIKNNDQVQTLTLSSDVHVQMKAPSDSTVRIRKDDQGMYRVTGKINEHDVKFLVDTGATQMAMSLSQAHTLKIDLPRDNTIQVETASGKAQAYQINIRSVKIGDIVIYDVPAVVVEGDTPAEVLLGMSFLKRVEMKDQNSVLELKHK